MRRKRSWAVGLLLSLPCVAWTQESEAPSAPPAREEASAIEALGEAPSASEPEMAAPISMTPAPRWHYLTRVEATTWALLPRAGMGAEQGFAQIEPTFIID